MSKAVGTRGHGDDGGRRTGGKGCLFDSSGDRTPDTGPTPVLVCLAHVKPGQAHAAGVHAALGRFFKVKKRRAERRLGELLVDTPKNEGVRFTPKHGGSKTEPPAAPPKTLVDMGIDKKLSARSKTGGKGQSV